MLSLIVVLLLVAVGAFFVWKSWDGQAFNWKMGLAGIGAVGVAVWEWFNGLLNGVM